MGPAIQGAVNEATRTFGTEFAVSSVYFATGEKIENRDTDGRKLVRDIVVHVSAPVVLKQLDAQSADIEMLKKDNQMLKNEMEQMKKMHAKANQMLKNEMEQMHAKANVKRVRNTATQILLIADGKEFKVTRCTRFTKRGESDKGVKDAAAALGVTAAQFISRADKMVTVRNKEVHFRDVDELDAEVEEVASIITPALQDLVQWECSVVLKYEDIKAAFPDGFQMGGDE
ncbi:hypothetical protein VaNZ11_010953 [Volvox africanus]|uniref:Uncharacterized protein n=1 Tax=Volvox africanus TaxID=51714 RepID=A0ABQ5S4C9_9CHLO|nr:hypothetical protein VaNZ11_008085 [Volvox africanus]GLI66913.1 hypothetical protein VaNZ11_010945 [Volvox africanus]GLI66914.1 hypothetical protein VaNZ11_010947 [Volvox africanus]GLI66919.1 hypothetical protein VaNZ11_010953 [Volvox africanus]